MLQIPRIDSSCASPCAALGEAFAFRPGDQSANFDTEAVTADINVDSYEHRLTQFSPDVFAIRIKNARPLLGSDSAIVTGMIVVETTRELLPQICW